MVRNAATPTPTPPFAASAARLGALASHLQAAAATPNPVDDARRRSSAAALPVPAPAAWRGPPLVRPSLVRPSPVAVAAEAKDFKVYISADIEGIGGVVNEAHLGPGGSEYEKAREWMTKETVAAATAALEAGATAVVISDSHGNGLNIMPDELPANCTLVRSWPRELGMMCGLDSSFSCALLVGYHRKYTSNPTVACDS